MTCELGNQYPSLCEHGKAACRYIINGQQLTAVCGALIKGKTCTQQFEADEPLDQDRRGESRTIAAVTVIS